MHLSAVVLLSSFAASAIATCAADNCLRAIRASAFPTRPGTADCSSYFLTTVSPSTVTSTVYPTETVYADKRKRDPRPLRLVNEQSAITVTPTAIPAYASPCSGSVRYSSACSCIGVTPSITTLSTPSTTITVAGPTQTVVDTLPFINFAPFQVGNEDCSGPQNAGPDDYFVAGECRNFVGPDSIFLEGIVAGSCADTSNCVLELFESNNCGKYRINTIPSSVFTGCINTEDAQSGILVCPDCEGNTTTE